MRTFRFLPESDAYKMAHEAMLTSTQKLSLAEFRTAARLFDKWEAAGEPADPSAKSNGFVQVYKNPTDCEIKLEEAEFNLLKQFVEQAPFLPRASRQLVGLLDLLDGTPSE